MRTTVVACKTLEDELNFAMKKTDSGYSVEWINSGLHNFPEKLNACLCELLKSIKAERVLLAFGYCGNSIAGLRAENFELIIPRVEDCISMLIGSDGERAKVSADYAPYYLTEGWLRGERNLWVEYQHSVQKFGEKQARSIAETMYNNYRTLGLLDTGIKSMTPFIESTKQIANTLKLEQKIIPATVSYLELLLTGPWQTEKFLIKAPGESITFLDLYRQQ